MCLVGIGVVVVLQKNREDVAPQQEINGVEVLEAETTAVQEAPAELPPKEQAPARKKVSTRGMKDQILKTQIDPTALYTLNPETHKVTYHSEAFVDAIRSLEDSVYEVRAYVFDPLSRRLPCGAMETLLWLAATPKVERWNPNPKHCLLYTSPSPRD